MEKSEILSEILRVADELDESPSVPKFNEMADFTHIVATEEFGSWNDAKKEAGLEVIEMRPPGKSKHTLAKKPKVENSCKLCSEDYCAALSYHHLNPSEKEMGVSKMLRTPYDEYDREDVKREIQKCILVCANCHRKIHSKHELEIDPGKLEPLKL